MIDGLPFEELAADPSRLCVTFLSHPPTANELAPLTGIDWEPERFHASGREIDTWHPEGQARSPLATALGKLELRGAVITRNWNAVRKLAGMLG